MASIILILAIILIITYRFYKYSIYRPPNSPPGPPRFPIYGSLWLSLFSKFKLTHLWFEDLAETYGKTFSLYLGSALSIVVTDYHDVKEILSRTEFDGRLNSPLINKRSFDKQLGIFFTDGTFWHKQRRFALRYLRDHGFSRRSNIIENVVEYEIKQIVDLLNFGPQPGDEEVIQGDLVLIPDLLYPGFINAFTTTFNSEQYPREAYPLLRNIGKGASQFVSSATGVGGFVGQTPFLRFLAPKKTGFKDYIEGNEILVNFVKAMINKKKTDYIENPERSFADYYLNTLKEKMEGGEKITFSEEQLTMIGTDLLLASANSVTTTMSFIFMNLIKHPHVQKKIQAEIDDVVGRGRFPTLDDRPNLPYTEATIRETMRRQTIAPLAVAHRTMVDTTFRNYDVPKDTMVFVSLYSMNMDKKVWGDPENFRPERYLDENGRLKKSDMSFPFGLGRFLDTMVFVSLYSMNMDKKVWGDPENFRPERYLDENGRLKKSDMSFPFGLGKRLCAGETFARQNIFLFMAGLLQNFTFAEPKHLPLPYTEDPIDGFVLSTKSYWAQIIPRN